MMTGGKIHQANNANNALQVRKPAQHLSRKDPDVAEDLSACVLLIAAAGIGFNRDLHDSSFSTGKRSTEHAAGACFSSCGGLVSRHVEVNRKKKRRSHGDGNVADGEEEEEG